MQHRNAIGTHVVAVAVETGHGFGHGQCHQFMRGIRCDRPGHDLAGDGVRLHSLKLQIASGDALGEERQDALDVGEVDAGSFFLLRAGRHGSSTSTMS